MRDQLLSEMPLLNTIITLDHDGHQLFPPARTYLTDSSQNPDPIVCETVCVRQQPVGTVVGEDVPPLNHRAAPRNRASPVHTGPNRPKLGS